MSAIFEGQTVRFEFTVTDQDDAVVDISAATLSVVFEKPSEATITKTAILTNDGTDGKMEYTTTTDDLDETGPWKAQGMIVIGTEEYPATIEKFMVSEKLS